MSAFVVTPEIMHRVVEAILARNHYGQIVPCFLNIDTTRPAAGTDIGRILFKLNIQAVQCRYPDTSNNPGALPGSAFAGTEAQTYEFTGAPMKVPTNRLIAGVKAMRCLIYQCSEGDFPLTDEYRELYQAAGSIAMELVSRTPGYEAAPWG